MPDIVGNAGQASGGTQTAPSRIDEVASIFHAFGMMHERRKQASRENGRVAAVMLTEADLRWRHDGMGRLLNVAVRRMQARVIAKMVRPGHTDMRLALVNLTRNLDIEGTTLTELARRAVMTKQAMGELADSCEKLGIIERTIDPADRRLRLIKFTAQGMEWLSQLGLAVAEAEAEMRGIIGDPAYRALADWLKAYNHAPLPELEPDWTGPAEAD